MDTIVFCGGGSAGHVIPNIAIIERLKDDYNCVYIGTGGIEKNICRENGVTFYECDAPKLVRGKMAVNFLIPPKLINSVKAAAKILQEVKPVLIFSKGGYACLPAVLAAKKQDIPVITHESDIIPGLATKLIAGRCVKVLTSFPSTAKKFKNGICTGSPIRSSAIKSGGKPSAPVLLVLGGGSGSKKINQTLRQIVPELCKSVDIIHICGKDNLADCNIPRYRQIEFADDMGSIYGRADIAVSRCGSNTAFELIANRIPTLFIPLDNGASRGDQVDNAQYFKDLGLCEILYERDLTPESLKKGITDLLADKKIKAALDNYPVKNGTENIINEIKRTIR